MPKECHFDNDRFNLSTDFNISVIGHPGSRIYGAATRMLQRLKGRTGLFIKQFEVHADSMALKNLKEPAKEPIVTTNQKASFLIEVEEPGVNRLNEDESYTLTITAARVLLKAKNDLGAMHGFETLLQLLQFDGNGYYFQSCVINDAPRFIWRGLLIDVSRHFMPVDVIKHNIDGMVAVKMNVLHLHLTDDHGFRIECKSFPKLHQLGNDGQYFTQQQIKEIIAYADDRGIRVVPEFDIPGHTASWFVGYPELASGEGPYSVIHGFGEFKPTMNPIKESTYGFLDTFFREMTALFPDDYMHIGGDENNGMEWNANSSIKDYMKAHNLPDNDALQAYFNTRVLAIITKYEKKMIGWDEIKHANLPKDIVIQSWRGKQGLVDAAKSGFQAILSNGYYIDLVQSAEFHYKNDPLPSSIALTPEQQKLILGGEATMWSEMVTWETVDSRIWPRTAAIAERLWSPASVTDVTLMYQKLDRISIQLEELGLTHEKNYEMFLRRLTGNYEIDALKTLVDVLEPIKLYHRVSTKEVNYTTDSPYTRVVDAARPDARVARNFNSLVDEFLSNQKDKVKADEIKHFLNLWIHNQAVLAQIISKTPALKEIDSLSVNLTTLSKIGEEAMNFIESNKIAQKTWVENSIHKIKVAEKPKAQTEIAIVKGIRKLVDSVKR
jgi:hexosaminidase